MIDVSGGRGARSPADEARIAGYADLLAFHEGRQWTERPRRGESRLVLNYARALIRKTASYVFPAPVHFTVVSASDDPADIARGNVAERLLAETIADLDLPSLDLALAVDAAVLGDAAMKVTWDVEAARPRVAAVDPAGLIAHARADDPRALTGMTHTYRATGAELDTIFPVIRDAHAGGRSGLDAGRTYTVIEAWTGTRWRLEIAGQLVHDEENPYGWVPYVVAANNPRPRAFWGESDLVDLLDVCRELNRRMTVLSRILELSGAPIAVLENVHGSEGISVGPGAKWELPEGAKAYLLDLMQGGGSQLHLAYIEQLFRTLHDLSETPRTAFGDSGRDLSGAALEVEIQPLVQKVGRMRRMWEGVFARRNTMLLDLLERFGDAPIGGVRRTSAIWPPILPSDTDAQVRNTVALVGAGVQSRRSAIGALGNADPDAELERIAAEGADASAPPSS